MSEDVSATFRAILLQAKMSKSLEEAVDAIEIIVGPANTALVNDALAKRAQNKKS